jgi:hypothetical protein
MKVFVPRNIEKGWLNMNFQIGPLSFSLIQLVILAGGIGFGLLVWNTVVKTGGNKSIATILALLVISPFLVVAFFKMSELTLLPFLSKLRRNRFLDTTKKTQTNDTKIDPLQIMIKSSHAKYEDMQKQEQKTLSIDDFKNKKKLSSDDLLS